MVAFLARRFRFVIAIALLPLVAAFAVTLMGFLAQHAQLWVPTWFGAGFWLALPLLTLLVAAPTCFTRILEHELGHAVMTMLLRGRVKKLEVTPHENGQRGVVEFGQVGCLASIVFLSPYFLPLFTIPFLLMQPLAGPGARSLLNLLIGVTYVFHIAGLAVEFRPIQTDLTKTGCLFSVAMTVLLNAVILVLIIGVVTGNLGIARDYLVEALQRTREFYAGTGELLASLRGG